MSYPKQEIERNLKYQTLDEQSPPREKLSNLLFKHAHELRSQADKLENLAKGIDILPNEMEALLYPYLMDTIFNQKRYY